MERALKNRGQEITLKEFRLREAERRQFLTRLEELRHERNTLSKEVGALMQAGKRDERLSLKIGRHPLGMHPGIGAPGPVENNRNLGNPGKGLFHDLLD